MSFGDGMATSVGFVGGGKILKSNGTAEVIPTSNKAVITPIPTSSSLCSSEKGIHVDGFPEQEKLIYNICSVIVDDAVKRSRLFTISNSGEKNSVKTTYATNNSINIYLKPTCYVSDENDDNKHILKYLNFDALRIDSPTIPIIFIGNKIIHDHLKPRSSVKYEKPTIKNTFLERAVTVEDIEETKEIINFGYTFVENRVSKAPQEKNNIINIYPATVNVEDYKPPVIGGGGNAGGVSSFRIIAQKFSYFEYYMSFTDGKVVGIDGLPQGMIFEKSYLKGSPIISGEFPINIKLDNRSVLTGLLIVTQVPRQL